MISLGLRLSLKGGREAGARLALTALGVAVGVALLLFTLSGFNGLKAKDARKGWLLTSQQNRIPSVDETTADPLWWRLTYDAYGAETLVRLEVAPTGPRSPMLPGLSRLPEAGEYYVSPALARLIASTPADTLGERFPGRQEGLIGEAGLTSPDALTAVVGRTPAELETLGGAMQVRSIETAPQEHDYSDFLRIVLGLGAIGLLIPVMVFVATSTRLAAARREERFAAMRLVGATPGQVNTIASVEAGLAAAAGTLVGFAGFWVFRPLVARIPFTGDPFFTSDLSLGWSAIVGVAVGVPLVAVAASLLTLRRVRISPLGITRRVTPKPPRAWRLVPMALGLGALGAVRILPEGDPGMWAILGAFAVIIVGLMVAGPWLTMVGARLLAKRARRDSTLIAGRRLSDDPGRAFRAISGLVLAVFVGSVFIGVVGTAIERTGGFDTMTLPPGSVSQRLSLLQPAQAQPLLSELRGLEGVRLVVPVSSPEGSLADEGADGLVAAADWRRLGVYGSATGIGGPVAADAVVTVPTDDLLLGRLEEKAGWPAAAPPAGGLAGRPLQALLVTTDGREQSIERVRTTLQVRLPGEAPAISAGQLSAGGHQLVEILQRMVTVGIILSLAIAGCSLAVSVAGGLIERKRPFSLLRLAGMPLSHLRRVVVLEAAVPLVLAAFISGAAGLFAADLILRATPNGFGLSAPPLSYYLIMGGGMAAALAIVGATLPLLGRVTELETARME
jgi:cell division protein FtsX